MNGIRSDNEIGLVPNQGRKGVNLSNFTLQADDSAFKMFDNASIE